MLNAPFPWFGGKSRAATQVWSAFGDVDNYIEPFCGSAAMLLSAPDGNRVETINDADGFVANFWRAIRADSVAVAEAADWPTNECDLFARHSWLVRNKTGLIDRLHADPEYYNSKIAGWWCWGLCNWIGRDWCDVKGPWVHDGKTIVNRRQLPHLGDAGQGINRQLPHLGDAGQGINRQLPHLGNAGRGINRQLPHLGNVVVGDRSAFIHQWFSELQARLRDVRVACGDWSRVVTESVTTRHGVTAIFFDPPYTLGEMDYAVGGVGGKLAIEVQTWCAENCCNPLMRIVLCGHHGEHDSLLDHGWTTRKWTARKGYAMTDDAKVNSASETLWCSPHCIPEMKVQGGLF